MNAQIRKLFLVLCLLFVAVIATTTYWLWRSPDLEARQGNPTLVVRQLTIKRGLIFASDGRTVLARNRPRKVQGRTWYLRTYPQDDLTAHVVGYSTVGRSRAGLEKSMNDFLTGSNANLSTVVNRTIDKLRGLTQVGNDLVLTIDARGAAGGARPARGQLRRGRGARPANRRRARDGVVAAVQPESRRGPIRGDPRREGPVHAGRTAAQPGHPGPVHPRIDVQGDHRLGGPRVRPLHA